MRTANGRCERKNEAGVRCGAPIVTGLDRRGTRIDLDPEDVVGGGFCVNYASGFIEERPAMIRPKKWDSDLTRRHTREFLAAATAAADAAPWLVVHECGRSAEQIVKANQIARPRKVS